MDTEMYIELLEEKIRRQRSKVRGARKQVAERDEALVEARRELEAEAQAGAALSGHHEAKIKAIRDEVLKAHASLTAHRNRGAGSSADMVEAWGILDRLVQQIR